MFLLNFCKLQTQKMNIGQLISNSKKNKMAQVALYFIGQVGRNDASSYEAPAS